MKSGLTWITLLLDRSYSMDLCADRVVDAVNLFLDEQRAVGGDARLTFALFNTSWDLLHDDAPIAEVPRFTMAMFAPWGSTSLYESFAEVLARTEARVAAAPDAERPEHVVFVILTDGLDDGCGRVSLAALREKVERLAREETWRFLFLGANFDAFVEGSRMGTSGLSFRLGDDGLAQAAATASAFVGMARRGDATTAAAIGGAKDIDDPAVRRAVSRFRSSLGASDEPSSN
jgi:hypothetical protein